jgi:signal transduction histidine kinase
MLSNSANPAPATLATDEALAILAHELRDPLAAILLAMELLPGDSDPAVQQARSIVQHQARRAVRIVDDLLASAPVPGAG